jgi:hypothetical protein
MSHFWQVGACDLPCIFEAGAEVLLSFFFPKPESDVVGGDHQVLHEAEGAAFSVIKEDGGGDGGD